MSLNVACETCCYWSKDRPRPTAMGYGFPASTEQDEPQHVVKGQCRRYPPFMVRTEKGPRAQWPLTLSTHWCGEHGEVIAKREAAE